MRTHLLGTLWLRTHLSGTLRSGTLRSGTLQSGTLWSGTLRSGTLWLGTLRWGGSGTLPCIGLWMVWAKLGLDCAEMQLSDEIANLCRAVLERERESRCSIVLTNAVLLALHGLRNTAFILFTLINLIYPRSDNTSWNNINNQQLLWFHQ